MSKDIEADEPKLDTEFLDQIILLFRKLIQHERRPGEDDFDFHFRINKIIFASMVSLRDFERLPQVLKDRDYNALPSEPCYRGSDRFDYHGNMLCDYNYHKGVGAYSNGLYFSTDRARAKIYSSTDDTDIILTAKISPDAKILTLNEAEKKWIAIRDYMQNDEIYYKYRPALCRLFRNDLAKTAMAYGYDGLQVNDFDVAIFNRAKIVVSESEQKRILENCNMYNRDGTINFAEKLDQDYFPDV